MKRTRFGYFQNQGWTIPRNSSELDSPQSLVLAFASPELKSELAVFQELRRAFPRSIIMGCSTAGEIHGDHVLDHSIAASVCRFEHSLLRRAALPMNAGTDGLSLGKALGAKLADPKLSGVILFTNGLKINGTELAEGISAALPPHVPVTGGVAGDGMDFGETFLIQDTGPSGDLVVAVGFYGDRIRLAHGAQAGWNIFGPERRVTRSEKNRLYELDGRPALALYKEYMGQKASRLPSSSVHFPLEIRYPNAPEKPLIRAVLGVDEEQQALIFGGDIPVGSRAQLMYANFDRLIDAACKAADSAQGPLDGSEALCLAISCIARRVAMGGRVEEELEATLEAFPKGVEQIGFYSYGELSPLLKGGPCELHNQTMTLTTLWEE